jgi:hypothetical protein
MKNILKSFILILIVTSVVPSQSTNGSIGGTLRDWFGAVFHAMEIKLLRLTKDNKELVVETKSNQSGEYIFSNLPLGVYEMQVTWSPERVVRKRVELTSSAPVQKNIDISNKPCSDEPRTDKDTAITNSDRAEIVRELVNLKFPKPVNKKIIFVPRNIDVAWLGADQKAKMSIMTRLEVQDLADKTDQISYYWVSPFKQNGGCIEATMNSDVAVKGELEDANMAGGGMIYEFKKIDGRWIGQAIGGWIS